MDFMTSLALVFEDLSVIYIGLIFFSVTIVYYLLLKGCVSSIFDPLFYYVVSSVFASFVAVAYWQVGLINDSDFYWIVFCTFCFYFGLRIVNSKSSMPNRTISTTPPRKFIMGLFFFLIINQFTIYSIFGIPLFMDSRLTQFSEAGGWGVISRLSSVLMPYILFCVFVLHEGKPKRIFFYGIVIALVVFMVLSGSKSAIVNVFWSSYVSGCLFGSIRKKISKIYFIFALFVSLLVLMFQNGSYEILPGIVQFGIRLLAYGDVYSYAYINNVIEDVAHKDYFALIYPLLQPLRIVSSDVLPIPGFELYKYVYGLNDVSTGPNPRLPVYFDFFYNRFFFVIPFLIGLALGYTRRLLFMSVCGWECKVILYLLYLCLCTSETDPIFSAVFFFNIMFFGCGITFFYYLLFKREENINEVDHCDTHI